MARHAMHVVFAGAAAAFGLIVCGAGAPKGKDVDIRKLRVLKLVDKDLPVVFALPAPKKSAKGAEPVTWGFLPIEEKRAQAFEPFQKKRDEYAKALEEADSGDGKKKLSDADRSIIDRNLQTIARVNGMMAEFFNRAKLAVEVTGDKSTGVVMAAIEMTREFKLPEAVAAAKSNLPVWRIGQAEGDPKVVYDKRDARFKDWEGWKVVLQSTGKAEENETPPVYYDAVHVYRRALKSGKVFKVEICAHWTKGKDKEQSFDKEIDALLKGLRF